MPLGLPGYVYELSVYSLKLPSNDYSMLQYARVPPTSNTFEHASGRGNAILDIHKTRCGLHYNSIYKSL